MRRFTAMGIGICLLLVAFLSLVACGGNPSGAITGQHITAIQVGTGFDQKQQAVRGESGTFQVGQTLYVVFTINTSDSNAIATLKIFNGVDLEDTSLPVSIKSGTAVYEKSVLLNATGDYTIEIDYKSSKEASIPFAVN
ncbi:hypothetical protein [Dictyobacter aurantiacus]|uniref:YtkA-like domain-containing protein n=1 Tax=Dictyobacter aurantiacus TaxID=1936993 RepID=A0A401ZRM9_9CHLR|nr:hypothetical protein [Dictyobacter aurantiacus]GCE09537.1 hypothetical protein KDAU_68660 [Dictyobacter aurantiacus]